MAPAASILVATSGASKRPAASSDAEQLLDSSSSYALPQVDDDAARSKSKKRQLECPRCRSTNTKFCYYNNYSTAQPRHFCRACRRYWTHGGTLRDVPVGGATRCSKRRRASAEPSSPLAHLEDACPPDLSTAFPFLSGGSYYLPQFDVGLFAPPAFSWPSVVPDFCDGLTPWDDGTVAGLTGPWGDIAGLELSWPPAEQLFVAAGFSSAASGSVLPSMQLQS